MILPKLKHGSGIRTTQQVRFGGLNHTKSASEGDIYDMLNISSREYPLIATRLKRKILSSGEDVKAVGDRWIIKGKDFIYDGQVKNEFMPLSDTPKRVVEMGAYVLIFPDRYYYNSEQDKPFAEGIDTLTVTSIFDEDSFMVKEELPSGGWDGYKRAWINGKRYKLTSNGDAVGSEFRFGSSDIKVDDIVYPDKGFGLMHIDIGEGRFISGPEFEWVGDTYKPYKLGVEDGDVILFKSGIEEFTLTASRRAGVADRYSMAFRETSNDVRKGTWHASRNVPDFELMCVCGNRLWGVYDGTIYASKLGDPCRFYVYNGLSTDSWAVDYLTKKFTGAITYNEKPTFWTEDSVITVYGSTPSTYQASETNLNGVLNGAGSSLTVVGGYLYYLSPQGLCVYGGRYPTDIHVPIGEKITSGFGFTDGSKYYIDTGAKIYVYDSSVHLWHVEDSAGVCNYNVKDGILSVVTNNGDLCGFTGEGDEVIDSFIEFGDFYFNTGDKKTMSKLNIRLEADEGAEINILVKYDSTNEWQTVKVLTATKKRSFYLPFTPRRCDHYRLRFEGKGNYTIYSISQENYIGSAN